MTLERLCRGAAIVIAVLAVIDPTWVVARPAPLRVVVHQTDGATANDLARVTEVLTEAFTVETVASPDTAARVVVGRRTPDTDPADLPTFLVVPDAPEDAPDIRRVQVGDVIELNALSRVAVELAVPDGPAATPAAPRTMHVSLSADGVPVDVQEVAVAPGATTATATLLLVPGREGLTRLRVTARLGDGPQAMADAATEVVATTRRVLVYEARPSWAATFVRRALEADPRLDVVVRSVTSRGVTVDAGAPPATLERADDLADFAVVVVSSPDAVSDRAAAALETYLRDREGAVVLLPEGDGGPILSQLTGISGWRAERRPALESVTSATGTWTASEFLWPEAWPAGAEAITSCLSPTGGARRCAVWRLPVGGGRVVVSSAIDGWRTRTTGDSAFVAFWQSLIGDEAATTPAPLSVGVSTRLPQVGDTVMAEVRLHGPQGTPVAEWQGTDGSVQPVRLWPAGTGAYRAAFRVPDVPGRYRLRVTVGPSVEAASEFLVVDPGVVHRPLPGDAGRMSAFAAAHGGEVVAMADVTSLGERLRAALDVPISDTPTRPMRSPWWIAPFAGLLAGEWWSRRRRGAR